MVLHLMVLHGMELRCISSHTHFLSMCRSDGRCDEKFNKTRQSKKAGQCKKGQTLKQQKADRQANGVARDGVAGYGVAPHPLLYRENTPRAPKIKN